MFAVYFSFKIICGIREKRGYKQSITSFQLLIASFRSFLGRWSIMHVHVPEGGLGLLVDPGLLTGSRERAPDHDDQGPSIMAVHLWLRAETKPNERRTHITPERCKDLVKAGKDGNV